LFYSFLGEVSVAGLGPNPNLPPINNLYTPMLGFAQREYAQAVDGYRRPGASWLSKSGNFALATGYAIPALAEGLVTGLYNAPNNAALSAQRLARANLQTDPKAAFDDRTAAFLLGTEAALGATIPGAAAAPAAARLATQGVVRLRAGGQQYAQGIGANSVEAGVLNLTERGTLSNLRPQDPAIAQRPVRTLVQDESGRYWLQSPGGNRITPSGSYDFVTLPDGTIRVARPNPNPDFSTHLGLSGGGEVNYAGSIRFGNNMGPNRGTITQWTNNSGHYQPPSGLSGNAGLPDYLFRSR
jgi:hypothetical protein